MDYGKISDYDLTILIRGGDRSAFTEVFNRYNSILYIHAAKKFANREDARDIIQEVFGLLWSTREELEPKSNLSGYLYTCVHHRVLNWFNRQKIQGKYIAHIQSIADANHGTTDNLARERQLSAIIEKEIESLPPKMREVFKMSRYDQLSHKEIAEILNIGEDSVRSHVKNALKILRVKFGLYKFLIFLIFY
ncbi:MAG TPA: RNA polymerase sigma-70 factor [Pedobacter sp.]|uniref:RNA polymerase sigma factor n=1 Tax=Pedobacter sp. TaxID=1411316 RepID=UPI002BB96170|nr:RNA polymerase sigma-70 factor [Pedobacter sp.]HMI04884.1 RNA polymerase sigma-70 factor [Pedobacter sp.]